MELPGLPRNRICSYGAARAQQYQKTKEPKKPKKQRTKKNKKPKNHKNQKKQSFPIYVARCSLGWLSRGLGFGFAKGAAVQCLGSTWGYLGHLWSTWAVPEEYLGSTWGTEPVHTELPGMTSQSTQDSSKAPTRPPLPQ